MKEPETGKKENTGKSGYSITTWRLHLWCRHPEWLRTTQEFYNRIAEFITTCFWIIRISGNWEVSRLYASWRL